MNYKARRKISTESIVVYFDIFGSSEMKKDNRLANKILKIWKWINEDIMKRPLITERRCYLFSDGGFLFYFINKDTTEENKYDILKSCYFETTALLDEFLKYGFFLRGAISFGKTYFVEEGDNKVFVGDPIVHVVRLESEKCPGPFIIIPVIDINKLLHKEHKDHKDQLISFLPKSTIMPTKDQKEKMEVFILRPSKFNIYYNIIKDNADKYTREGPYNFGKFWHDAYLELCNTFDTEGNLK
jgi:hypothetical protein